MTQAYSDQFSDIYNFSRWKSFSETVAPKIHNFYQRRVSTLPSVMLDVCCGGGQLANYFLKHDFEVFGFDLSERMIYHAKNNNKEFIDRGDAHFFVKNAVNFTFDEKFSLITATYDAMNHIETKTELEKAFSSIFKVLSNDGFFIFDMNTEKGLENWNGIFVEDHKEMMVVNRGFFNKPEGKAFNKTSGFIQVKKDLYKRFDELLFNKVYKIKDVREILLSIGWSKVHFASSKSLEKEINEPEKENRVFIIAKK